MDVWTGCALAEEKQTHLREDSMVRSMAMMSRSASCTPPQRETKAN